MKFASSTDIEATLDHTFNAFANFELFEKMGVKSGAAVRRLECASPRDPGAQWQIDAKIRGKQRHIELELTSFDRPEFIGFKARTGGVKALIKIDLIFLSARHTRANLQLDLNPKTISARLFVQGVKLVKKRVDVKIEKGLKKFGNSIELSSRSA